MRQLLLASALTAICFLLPWTAVVPTVNAGNSPIKWTIRVWPKNRQYLEVTLRVKDGFCVRPELPFDAHYYDEQGNLLGSIKTGFFNDNRRREKVCAATEPYVMYHRLERPVARVRAGLMYWRVLIKPPQPYRVRGMTEGN